MKKKLFCSPVFGNRPAEFLSFSEFSESDSDLGRELITCVRPITVAGSENLQLLPLQPSSDESDPPAYKSETEEEKNANSAIIQEMVMLLA